MTFLLAILFIGFNVYAYRNEQVTLAEGLIILLLTLICYELGRITRAFKVIRVG